jgi:hypothetical protein
MVIPCHFSNGFLLVGQPIEDQNLPSSKACQYCGHQLRCEKTIPLFWQQEPIHFGSSSYLFALSLI